MRRLASPEILFRTDILNMKLITPIILLSLLLTSCSNDKPDSEVPVIGFLDFIQDPTIELAKQGFFDALKIHGYSEDSATIQVVYANAQGDIPTLGQSCDYIISKQPDLIGTNITLSTITAVKRTASIPIFMMVAPRPDIAGLLDKAGNAPLNLSGVYETLDYIDSAVVIIKELVPNAKSIGTIYNQSEPQSKDAFDVLQKKCNELGLELMALPVNNSSEAQLVTQSLLAKKPDVFFALPDNVIFAAFETVAKACNEANVPIFTSEAGLVARGALASFGADFYYWGYQSGNMAAKYLMAGKKLLPVPEMVEVRRKVYNPETASRFNVTPDSTFFPFNSGKQ